ncbi:ligand-dependent nuclear receptor-interacting factor 1-like [Grus americana]|uniref:ligand-dependent nuclear receptor-interacting factor 1-like n=1 Tax=Grus americana TaxID=9117 RepID=UPI002407F58F|nr:ligand-dependent nuclear receptor-interacting factor 1-like [Grus americana]
MLEYQQLNSEEDFSTGSFDMLENVGMTSAQRGNFSTVFNAQSNETSVEKHSLLRCLSLVHADQEDTASVSGISELLKVTEEPQAQILKHDLEIPPQAKITSIPLSSFPPKMQQLMSARAKNVSEVRQATEIPTVTYVWPVIKTEDAFSPLWDIFPKSLIPTSPNLTRHCSSPDVVIEDVKCSQITPVKQLAQEELDRKMTRSYPVIVKSSSSVVSGILKSLTNIKNKDYKNMLPLSSISPIGEQMEIPLFKENAIAIYNGQVYFLCVMRPEALLPEMEIHGCDMLLRKTTVWVITCSAIRDVTIKVPHPLLSRQDVVKRNINCLTTLATPPHQDKTSNATHFSSHKMTTISQTEQCTPSTGKRQQFLNKTAFPPKEGWQKRNEKEAHWEADDQLRKKFGIVQDVRVHLNRISLLELIEDSSKAAALKWKVTTRTKKWQKVPKFLNKTAFPPKEGWQKRNEKEAHWEADDQLRKKFGIVQDVRVHLNRISLLELIEDSSKAAALKWKVTTRTKKWQKVPKLSALQPTSPPAQCRNSGSACAWVSFPLRLPQGQWVTFAAGDEFGFEGPHCHQDLS